MTIEEFIDHIFNHPVDGVPWFRRTKHNDFIPGVNPTQLALLLTETYENSGVLLHPFSDAQVAQGLQFGFQLGLNQVVMLNDEVSIENSIHNDVILHATSSIASLFRQIMAKRCKDMRLANVSKASIDYNPLNFACYMWWEVTFMSGKPEIIERTEFDKTVLSTMTEILAIPHAACQESALHGLGHWKFKYPDRVEDIINRFLDTSNDISDEIIRYALSAIKGTIN
ncbi:hypothetical protein [Armatimonas sp.]|uniref:hypothetical protein n=1 Tax=Armatimonas sp. TaxID=1872638 RepID=UPI00286B92F0|nr:hypothetical protein [Armatimonas sp.]